MRLLVVGHPHSVIGKAVEIAQKKGIEVFWAEDIAATMDILRGTMNIEAVFVDIALKPLILLQSLKEERIQVPVFVCGEGRAGKEAAAAVRAGAVDFVSLPPNTDEIARIFEIISRKKEDRFYYGDPLMEEVSQRALKAASSDASIMIVGESGTGKEVMAHYIHRNSKRKDQPFVAFNCAAIPENLLESELFGHEKGAFTGAVAKRVGRFQQAHRGTLLLDEISEMDMSLQAKLLRVLQEKEVDPLGGTGPVKVDVRILATSNRNMKERVAHGEFREDLYFRLNVVELSLPPLRQRPEDIKTLSRVFIERFCEEEGKSLLKLTDTAQERLLEHAWPGNVRELENAMRRAVIFGGPSEITAEVIFQESARLGKIHADGPSSTESVREKDYIYNTLDYTRGDVEQAAEILGLSVRHLKKKMEDYKSNYLSKN